VAGPIRLGGWREVGSRTFVIDGEVFRVTGWSHDYSGHVRFDLFEEGRYRSVSGVSKRMRLPLARRRLLALLDRHARRALVGSALSRLRLRRVVASAAEDADREAGQ
jgi:hypothetical protein